MDYLLMLPPFELKDFSKMNKTEARQYFEWFIRQIPSRIIQLQTFFKVSGGGDESDLDYSDASLIKLWKWYIANIKLEKKTEDELRAEKERIPSWIGQEAMEYKVTTLWLSIAMDIGIYFAECFIKKYPHLEWGYVSKPKNLRWVNRPVLKGFKVKVELSPTTIIYTQVLKIIDGEKDENQLVKLFKVWERDV